jgi:hypothetical protein
VTATNASGKVPAKSAPVSVPAEASAPVNSSSSGVQAVGGVAGLRISKSPEVPITTQSGVVLVELPGTSTFVPLSSVTTVPLGTVIDATHGAVKLSSAPDAHGHSTTGVFDGGVFRVTQVSARSGVRGGRTVLITVLTLVGPLPTGCSATARGHKAARTAARGHGAHGTVRRLWGNAKGNFRTVGRYASATVRGTKWLTEDTCAGTLIRVARGVVSVEDLPHHRTRLLRAPHSLLSHPGRGG